MHRMNTGASRAARREFLRQVAGLSAVAVACPLMAQGHVTTIIVPFGPGGASDVFARILAQHLQARIGSPVIVDFKPGGNTSIGSSFVRRQPPDGTTLLLVPRAFSSSPATNPKINNYNPVKDFTPIARLANTDVVLAASTKFAPNTLTEVISYVKAHPGEVRIGTTGVGANDHLMSFRLGQRIGAPFNIIHYKGAGAAIQDLMSGILDLKIDSVASYRGALDAGRVKPICMINADGASLVPGEKSLSEQLPGLSMASYFGVVGPADMEPALVDRLSKELIQIVQLDEVQPRWSQLGISVAPLGPAEFASFMTAHLKETHEVVRDLKLPLE